MEKKTIKTSAAFAAVDDATAAATSNIRKPQKHQKSDNLLEKFNSLNACKWLNLESMEKNRPYKVNSLRRADTKFGTRIIAELDECFKINLPERYNAFTDKQLNELGGGKTYLINKGRDGKSYKLEMTKFQAVFSPASPESEQQQRQQQSQHHPEDEGVDEVDGFDPDTTAMGFYSQSYF